MRCSDSPATNTPVLVYRQLVGQLDLSRPPCLIEPRLKRAVKAQDREPAAVVASQQTMDEASAAADASTVGGGQSDSDQIGDNAAKDRGEGSGESGGTETKPVGESAEGVEARTAVKGLAATMVQGVVDGLGPDPNGSVAEADEAHQALMAEAQEKANKIIPPPAEPSLTLMILECMVRRSNTSVLLEEACMALQA